MKPASDPQASVTAYFQEDMPFWKEVYEGHDVFSVTLQERAAIAAGWVAGLAAAPDSRALEVGCGAGLSAVKLACQGWLVTATDSTPAMVDETRALAATAGVSGRVCTEIADVHQLAYPNASFDLVMALGVIPWLHTPDQALAEMARVLKPDGHLIVSADNSLRLQYILDPRCNPWLRPVRVGLRRLVGRSKRDAVSARMLSPRQFERALRTAGLSTRSAKTFGFGPFTLLGRRVLSNDAGIRLHRRLQRLANAGLPVLRRTGAQYIVLAQRSPDRPAA